MLAQSRQPISTGHKKERARLVAEPRPPLVPRSQLRLTPQLAPLRPKHSNVLIAANNGSHRSRRRGEILRCRIMRYARGSGNSTPKVCRCFHPNATATIGPAAEMTLAAKQEVINSCGPPLDGEGANEHGQPEVARAQCGSPSEAPGRGDGSVY